MTNTTAPQSVTYVTSGVSDFSDVYSLCCGDSEHRPAGNGPGSPWFCMSCGKTRPDSPPARRQRA
jgi:hypothetical protein